MTFVRDLEHLKQIVLKGFNKSGCSLSFAQAWIAKFLGGNYCIFVRSFINGREIRFSRLKGLRKHSIQILLVTVNLIEEIFGS